MSKHQPLFEGIQHANCESLYHLASHLSSYTDVFAGTGISFWVIGLFQPVRYFIRLLLDELRLLLFLRSDHRSFYSATYSFTNFFCHQ